MEEMPPGRSGSSCRSPTERASSNASSPCLGWRRCSNAGMTTLRLVQPDGRADQILERLLIDRFALADVNRAPRLALVARGEEPGGIFERPALGEGQLHGGLVGLAGADHSVVRPDRDAVRLRSLFPLRLLDHVGIGLLDQGPDTGEGLFAPILLCHQLTAFFTRLPIFFSSAAVSSFSAKEVGHMAPLSRFALSLNPIVA